MPAAQPTSTMPCVARPPLDEPKHGHHGRNDQQSKKDLHPGGQHHGHCPPNLSLHLCLTYSDWTCISSLAHWTFWTLGSRGPARYVALDLVPASSAHLW